MPITSVSASSVIMFRLKPIHDITAKVGISETGIATAAISVARQSRRNRNTTIEASAMPSSSAASVAVVAVLGASAFETMRSKRTCG